MSLNTMPSIATETALPDPKITLGGFLQAQPQTSPQRAKAIRDRLRNPVGAVKDSAIKLKHPHGVNGIEWAVFARIAREEAVAARKKALDDRIAAILAATKEAADRAASIQDWLFENPDRVNKTPPNFYNEIKRRVSRAFGSSIKSIDSIHRQKSYIIPRHVAMYLAFETMNISLPEIGRRTGMRDHTTALSAIRRMPKRMLNHWWLCLTVYELQTGLEQTLTKWRSEGSPELSTTQPLEK